MNNKNKSEGFTLIEVIIVIAILGIISGFMLPQRSMYQKYRLKAYSRQLCDDIRYVRHWNMNNEGTCRLAFTIQQLDKRYYRIMKDTKVYKRVNIPPHYQIYCNVENDIGFTKKGAPKMGGCTIEIRDTKIKVSLEITIVPASGRVLLKDEFNEK